VSRILNSAGKEFCNCWNDDDHLPKLTLDWALPPNRNTQRLTPKQRQFLMEKLRDVFQRVVRWKPEGVVGEMKTTSSKDPESGQFKCTVSEFLKVSTVRSFFSRQKAVKSPATKPTRMATVRNTDLSQETDASDESDDERTMRNEIEIDLEL
jgi:hypothetical protein